MKKTFWSVAISTYRQSLLMHFRPLTRINNVHFLHIVENALQQWRSTALSKARKQPFQDRDVALSQNAELRPYLAA